MGSKVNVANCQYVSLSRSTCYIHTICAQKQNTLQTHKLVSYIPRYTKATCKQYTHMQNTKAKISYKPQASCIHDIYTHKHKLHTHYIHINTKPKFYHLQYTQVTYT